MANENNQLVVSYFASVAAARATAEDLKQWDKANDAIKLGVMAILTLNHKGEIDSDEIGEATVKSGALWGTAIGVTVGILTAGIGLIPGMLLGAGGGAVLGKLMHDDVDIADAERKTIADRLRDGVVGLAVMADDFEVEATMAKMVELGGKTEAYVLPGETATAVTAVAEVQNQAVAAVDAAATQASDAAADVKRAVSVDLPNLPAAGVAAVAGLAAGIDINTADAAKLHDAGIEKVSVFYKLAATPQGRAELAAKTGLDVETIFLLEKKADLMRIKGVGPKYATLLVASGIDSVAELGQRNPANLLATMTTVNAEQHIVENLPSEDEVAGWVAQAKTLPRVIVS